MRLGFLLRDGMDNAKLKQWTRLWAVFLIAVWSLADGSYLLGSLLGILPQVLCFTVMGMKITEPGSPEFAIAMSVQIAEMLSALLVYRTILKRQKVSSASEKFR